MNEPAKQPKRSRRKPAMEPVGWDEIVSQPGMGGYLSFLNGPVPLPHLQGETTVTVKGPEVVLAPVVDITPEHSIPVIAATPVVDSPPEPVYTAVVDTETIPEAIPTPDVSKTPVAEVISNAGVDSAPRPDHKAAPHVLADPEVVSIPAIAPGRIRIRKCLACHDGHSLGEEVLYQALWKAASPESAETRTIIIGWRGMSQLCRMTPKNCKINTNRLIRKLALEVLSPYNTPESIGTTYRVFSDEAVLQRRRTAGLEWVIRSRGVEFVDPQTGNAVNAQLCSYALE